MKTIEISTREYITNFKKIAKFTFSAYILHGCVHITANINKLKELGY